MKISMGKTVAVEFTMSITGGETVESNVGKDPLTIVIGKQQIFEALENSIEGMAAGESKMISLAPEKTFGPINPEAIVELPVDQLPEDVRKAGTMIQTRDKNDLEMRGTVTAVDDESATIDFNHPLAGKHLNFDIRIVSVA